ncbi:glycosyltransferase family 4 protein [Curtobacterium sp. UCD-KPL2560]|uniref:glycosyltransferase family 4 protein n=1 Tax=Curtobacterium sp. UCD-KPL2560 TaxID=1885315 RepID=UPI00209AD8A2|nr:glycosyltransferase family 4 protein [Curtobacterium sp. UCD-KPL2560]
MHMVIRVIPELRPYHLELLPDWPPAATYYFEKKYDLADEDPQGVTRITKARWLLLMLKTKANRIEIWEPLWVRLLPLHFVSFGLFSVAGVARGKRRLLRSYCLENNEVSALLGTRFGTNLMQPFFRALVGSYIRLAYERLSYASESARTTYHSLSGTLSVPSELITNLPAAPEGVPDRKTPGRAVFVGRLETRKGILLLLEAWAIVEERCPSAKLHIVGSGPLSDQVEDFVRQSPESRSYAGFIPKNEIGSVLNQQSILIAPSLREGRWREQIGLPIQDGLRAGLTIVTTMETGLAPWLQANGHVLVAASPTSQELATAICRALARPLEPTSIRATLPLRDGRVSAAWYLAAGGLDI